VAVWTLTAAAVLLFLAVRVGITGPHLMQPRHTAALYLPALLTVFSAVLLLAEPRRRWALRIWTGAMILLTAASMAQTYSALARIGDWARVAGFLERNARPGEPILVLTAEAAIPLQRYYRGPNPLLPLPTGEDFKVYDTRELELRSEQHWLGIDYGFGVLEGYLAKRYKVERNVLFYGTRVRHFTTEP
jgi:hypothetical protein